MKRLGWILLGVMLLLAVGLGWTLRNLNRYLAENRSWIEQTAEAATGREVSFDEIGVSLWGGLSAQLVGLRVADDPNLAGDDFLRAASVRAKVALLPAFLGRIEVREIVIEEPLIRLIRTASGMNYETLGAKSAPEGKPGPVAGETDPGVASPAASVQIALLTIRDGQILYTDQSTEPPAVHRAERLEFTARGLGTSAPVEVDLRVAVLGADEPNVVLQASLGPLQLQGSGPLDPGDVDARLEIDPLILAGMPEPLRATAKLAGTMDALEVDAELRLAGLKGRITGDLRPGPSFEADLVLAADAAELSLASLGAASPQTRASESIRGLEARGELSVDGTGARLDGDVTLGGGSVRDVEFDAFAARVKLADDVLTFTDGKLDLFGGSWEGAGSYSFDGEGPPRFRLEQRLRALDVPALLESQAPAAAGRLSGKLSGHLDLSGRGDDADGLQKSLRGDGAVDMADGVLVGVNLPEAIVESLTGVAGLTTLLPDEVRTAYPQVFSSADTPFEEFSASVEIADGRATIRDARVSARDYVLRADGSLDFEGHLDLTATFVASAELTADVIKRVREARYLTDRAQRLAIPVHLSGVPPGLRVEPDAAVLTNALARGAVGKGLELLGLSGEGSKKADGAEGSSPRRGDETDGATTSSPEGLLREGLQRFFGTGSR